MDEFRLRLVFVFTDLILPLIVGYWLKRTNRISAAQCNWLIRFSIIVIFSILSVLSFWVLPLRPELILLPFFGGLAAVLPCAMAYVSGLHKRFTTVIDQGSYIITTMPSNMGTLGGLCSYILYGELGFAYAQIACVLQNILLFVGCFPLGEYYRSLDRNGEGTGHVQLDWRKVFINWNQLPMAAMVVGMVLYVADVPRPAVLGTIFNALIHISAWSALLPIGYMIDFSGLSQYYMKTLNLVPLKMIISPAILFFFLQFFFTDPVILGTMLILMAAPCAINALITVRLYDLNVNLSMAAFISTTAIYLILLYPLFYFFVSAGIISLK